MSYDLTIFVIDVAGMCAATLIGVHLLSSRPRNTNAQLLAFIAINSACARLLARDEYSPWIGTALQIDVGSFDVALNLARNLTPGLS